MRIVTISDNHSNLNFNVPDGDILIHAGDFSYNARQSLGEMIDFRDWLAEQPHKHKLFIWGNHELIQHEEKYWTEYLEESGAKCIHNLQEPIEIEGLKFWGSSFSPPFGSWSFMMGDLQRERHWEHAPKCDVLVTHSPPFQILDSVSNLGCKYLRKYVDEVKPKLHIFGHIHNSYGRLDADDRTFINTSLLNDVYELVNEPMVVEI